MMICLLLKRDLGCKRLTSKLVDSKVEYANDNADSKTNQNCPASAGQFYIVMGIIYCG
jgi:hypothetical protein